MYSDTAVVLLNADSCRNQWQKQWGIFIACLFFLKVPNVEETLALLCIVVDHVWRAFCCKNIVSSSSLAKRWFQTQLSFRWYFTSMPCNIQASFKL